MGRLNEVFNIILLFDTLASRLYEMRARLSPSDPTIRQTEDIVTGLSYELLQMQKIDKGESPYQEFVERYRRIWRENISLFFLTAFIFIGTCFVGWEIALGSPSFVSVILPQHIMEDIIEKHAWFHDHSKEAAFTGLYIAWNNIQVSINTFLGGALIGLGGLVFLIFNGIMFGAIMGFCYTHHFNEALTDFVVGHGMLELSIIVAAAFAGFVFGRTFYMRPLKLFRRRMAQAAADALYLLMGILPWLLLAASIESFISPQEGISFQSKFLLGLFCGGLFWVWTFLPLKQTKTDAIQSKAFQ